MTKWHSGPPPSLGWWPCKVKNQEPCGVLRWWNGKHWSWADRQGDSAEEAAGYASTPTSYYHFEIQWSDRPDSWPERSRT